MAAIQKISAEQAAHNIASIFSEQYIKKLDNPKMLSVDGTEISTVARKAAQLYAIAYDEAFDYISQENIAD